MAHLVTGYAGSEHIKSADDGSFNAAFFGEGCFVMEAGNQMDASIINNSTVRVLDGDLLMHGRHVRIEPNTYEDMTIETGTAGQKRIDLIVMTYEKDASDGVETAYLEVIKGAPTTGNPSVPSYTDGDILAGASFCQMPLYKVSVNGVVLENLETMFDTVSTFETTAEYYAEQFEEACRTHLNSLNVLDTIEEVIANTQANQLAGAKAVKGLHSRIIDTLAGIKSNTLSSRIAGAKAVKELNASALHIVSFDASTGTLVTKSSDYTG